MQFGDKVPMFLRHLLITSLPVKVEAAVAYKTFVPAGKSIE
jgi:hypothetical protein